MTPPQKEKCTCIGRTGTVLIGGKERCLDCNKIVPTPPSQTGFIKKCDICGKPDDVTHECQPHPPQDKEWEKKFNRRFCLDDDWDNQLYGYRPVGLVVVNNEVKDFIRNLLSERENRVIGEIDIWAENMEVGPKYENFTHFENGFDHFRSQLQKLLAHLRTNSSSPKGK